MNKRKQKKQSRKKVLGILKVPSQMSMAQIEEFIKRWTEEMGRNHSLLILTGDSEFYPLRSPKANKKVLIKHVNSNLR